MTTPKTDADFDTPSEFAAYCQGLEEVARMLEEESAALVFSAERVGANVENARIEQAYAEDLATRIRAMVKR